MIFKQDQNYWAVFYANEEALIVQTCSGLGLTAIDHLYPPPISCHWIPTMELKAQRSYKR